MALVVADRVKETTNSTGTGTISLAGAVAGFQSFVAGVGNTNTTYYAITDSATGDWEVGIGTVTSGTPDTLSRDTVLESSNSDNLVNFSAGQKIVICTQPAEKAVYLNAAGDLDVAGDIDMGTNTITDTKVGQWDTAYGWGDHGAEGYLTGNQTITLSGDVSGSGTTSIIVTVADDSHNHVISNIDSLQTTLDSKVPLAGGTMTGFLTLHADPTNALHAATKEYVDTIASASLHYHDPVRVESPINLTATYNNGTSGVGATLTNSGTQAALVIDGVTVALNDRVLIYEQTDATQNGVYTVTDVGSASTNWVLTRATDADSSAPSDPDALGQGDAFFVQEGDTGAGELYVMNTEGTITFGTTNITFAQISSAQIYSAGSGLDLTGVVFSHTDTSSQASVNNSNGTVIQDITLDTFGHITALGSADLDGRYYTETEVGNFFSGSTAITGYNKTNWDTAYGWGNHASAGYQAAATALTTSTTFGGDVSGTYNAIVVADDSHNHIISNVDGLQTALDSKQAAATALTTSTTFGGDVSGTYNAIVVANDSHTHDTSYYTETEIGSFFAGTTAITGYNKTNWDTAHGWGNHASQGYLTGNQTITLSGDVSGSGTTSISVTVADDSHTHDTRYYTETEADSRFVNVTGDNMTGTLTVQTLSVGTNTVSTTSDIALSANVAINAESSLSFGMTDNTNGYYRWMFGNTSKTSGTAGGTEKMRLDKDGNLSATTFTGALSGNAATATKWATARTITLNGDVSGSVSIDGSADVTLTTTVADDSHNHIWNNIDGASVNAWSSLRISNANGYIDFGPANASWAHIYTDRPSFYFNKELYTNNNRIFHDGYHPNADKWTTARTLTLNGDVSGSASIDGSADVTLTTAVADDSHNHSISTISDEHRLFNNMGDSHGTRTSFDATTPSYNFGWRFIQGATNGPGVNSATQYYSAYVGLGDQYPATGAGSYGMQIAFPRGVTTPYIAIRYNENNALGSWQKIAAGYADSAAKWTTARTITLSGDVTGSASFDGSADFTVTTTVADDSHSHSNYVTTTYNSSLNSDSRNSRGVTRLYRRDDNSDYSVQTSWTGSYWRLYGYAGDTFHADTHVGYADSAGNSGSLGGVAASGYVRGDGVVNNHHVLLNNGQQLRLGDSSSSDGDLRIYSTADATTVNYIDSHDGHIYIRANCTSDLGNDIIIQAKSGENSIACNDDSTVALYYDNALKLQTSPTGVFINGDLNAGTSVTTSLAYLGSYIYHSGDTDTYIGFPSVDTFTIRTGNADRVTVNNTSFSTTVPITSSGDITAFSDIRLKENVETIDNALDKVKSMRGVTYTKDGKAGLGVIAQEVEKVIPQVVRTADDEIGTKSVAYGNIVGLLIEAVKEQQEQIDALKNEITALKGLD